jgi:serine phosphatase RsbU (regulator of sigma subunit)
MGIIAVSSLVPLLIGFLSVQTLGRRYYAQQKGTLYATTARYAADRIDQLVSDVVNDIDSWITFSAIGELVTQASMNRPHPPDDSEIAAIENRWPGLTRSDQELQALLENPLAGKLREFQALYPLFAEVFVTDGDGRLIASTNKTSDYWQADEDWWQKAAGLGPHRGWAQGIAFDESAGVFSLDIAMPIRAADTGTSTVIGVVKGVLDVSPLLASLQGYRLPLAPDCHVVLEDGRILAGLFGSKARPLADSVSSATVALAAGEERGWMIGVLGGGGAEMIGCAPLDWTDPLAGRATLSSVSRMYVLVHKPAAAVLAPVRSQLWLLSGAGGALVFVFGWIAFLIAQRNIIAPLKLLDEAAGVLSLRATPLAGIPRADQPSAAALQASALAAVASVERIDTNDEIEELSRGFGTMARRILNYHEQLEDELSRRTEQVQRDLQMAREFQEALLPQKYPEIPPEGVAARLSLEFHHVYKPAMSVGGDFFDVIKLSDHAAGVFIADVMGHGARSALVTAILRTLLQNLAHTSKNPADLLTRMNQSFCEILPGDRDFIFASALYLVLDTGAATATYSSAGHPSPLLVDGDRKKVESLLEMAGIDPALGLMPHTTYRYHSRPMKTGDIFLLYTDGAVEAPNAAGDEFGEGRFKSVVETNIGSDAMTITNVIVSNLNAFMDMVMTPDDICIVAAGVVPAKRGKEDRGSAPR